MARTTTSIVLGPADRPQVGQTETRMANGLPNVWVILDSLNHAHLFLDNPDQADALAAAFTEAAGIMRADDAQ